MCFDLSLFQPLCLLKQLKGSLKIAALQQLKTSVHEIILGQVEKLLCKSSFLESEIRAITALKVSKYGVISSPYFPVFNPNTGKWGPEITPHLDTFHTVNIKQTAHVFGEYLSLYDWRLDHF